MHVVLCALALLSGVVGAGFASGRELVRFFAAHGPASGAAALSALATMLLLFLRLPAQLASSGAGSLGALCRLRFGRALGSLCGALFALLAAVTGGAMLAACAELGALTLPFRHAYGASMAAALLCASLLCAFGVRGLAAPGAALLLALPALLLRLLALPAAEACFWPAMSPDPPVRAAADGLCYGALNAALLCGALPVMLRLGERERRRACLLFTALMGALLALGIAVCRKHMAAVWRQSMPFVSLCRRLGPGGYALCALCLYAAALSTLCAMLAALAGSPARPARILAGGAACLLFARVGFTELVASFYPALGALCAALTALLCLPLPDKQASHQLSSSSR